MKRLCFTWLSRPRPTAARSYAPETHREGYERCVFWNDTMPSRRCTNTLTRCKRVRASLPPTVCHARLQCIKALHTGYQFKISGIFWPAGFIHTPKASPNLEYFLYPTWPDRVSYRNVKTCSVETGFWIPPFQHHQNMFCVKKNDKQLMVV